MKNDMEDESFYTRLNEEIERKQNIISALKKILQSCENTGKPKKKKNVGFFWRESAKRIRHK